MIQSYYNWVHSLGIHLYTIPSLILLAAAAITGLVHSRNANRREEKFLEELRHINKN